KGKPLLYPADDADSVDSLEQPIEFEQELVKAGDSCSYLKGTAAPPLSWMQNSFDDSKWQTGPTAIGYGNGDLGTSLADMKGQYVTLFLRHRFSLDSVAEAHRYTIVVTTNGGFYAWLNGRILTSANVSRPNFTSPARESQSLEPRRYQLGELTGRLVEGENVLAISGHNSSLDAEQFSISIELVDTEDDFGTVETARLRSDKFSIPFGKESYEVSALVELSSYLDNSTPLSAAEVARLDEIGIEEYVDFLERKIDRADDRVEFGFLRLRTDIYRVRQMMLGNEAGTKLATSPALAEIAKGDSAVATKDELSSFYARLKQTPKSGGTVAAPDTGGDGSPPVGVTAKPKTTTRSATEVFFSGEMVGGISGIDKTDSDKQISKPVTGEFVTDSRAINLAQFERSSSELFLAAASTKDVGQQNPVVGMVQNFNNATVGERLEESSANIAYQAGLAAKGELITSLLGTDDLDGEVFFNIDDLSVPGVTEVQNDVERSLKFSELRGNEEALQKLRNGDYDQVGSDDEAGHFNAGVRALENVVGLLRLIEGRIHAYRLAVERCRSTIVALQSDLGKADMRLKTIGTELAESRHDVSVARALRAEEEARIAAVNARRDKILETLVPFLLFRRPRTVDPRRDAPLHYVNPDLSEQPLPLCDLSEVETPAAVEAMLDVLREAPMKWFIAT
ncbi:MAG TPA: hypothetical protein VJ995_06780, partial [Geothermobacteraceae bacterium]|nr:hypothetical protein [Geothermobacteraceae bacterium]